MTGKNPHILESSTKTAHEYPPAAKGRWRRVFKFLLCSAVIATGIAGAAYIKKTAPTARKRPPALILPLVTTQSPHLAAHQIRLRAMGTVIPSKKMVLKVRVSGEVIFLHPEFIEGGFIPAGAEILKIDPRDYQLALAHKQAAVANARYALKLEMGHQEVARREWQLLKTDQPADPQDIELALRKPHLAKARADLTAARAELEQAELNLARTTLQAPFNMITVSKNVEIGSLVSPQDFLAEIIGTDEYWIKAAIATDRLKWIQIPGGDDTTGANVRIDYRNEHRRDGVVIKLLGDLETEGRMARLLIAVKDPLNLDLTGKQGPPLLIGEYVRLDIQGRLLENVYPIPRSALRDNKNIWLVDPSGKLEIRQVAPVWRESDLVVLRDGLQAGERLIISDLSKPVAGMPVRTQPSSPLAPTAAAEKPEMPKESY
jgi:RND family efflux transporter MFP subunit